MLNNSTGLLPYDRQEGPRWTQKKRQRKREGEDHPRALLSFQITNPGKTEMINCASMLQRHNV